MSEPVFRAQALTKVYRMGDAEVHALREHGATHVVSDLGELEIAA